LGLGEGWKCCEDNQWCLLIEQPSVGYGAVSMNWAHSAFALADLVGMEVMVSAVPVCHNLTVFPARAF
jgi:hypothetical protein